MIIKNLTGVSQKVEIMELTGDHRKYDIYLQPHGVNEIEGLFKLSGCNKNVVCIGQAPVVEAPAHDLVEVEETKSEAPAEEVPAVDVEETPSEEVQEDKFICDECGAEFASERGLATHKKRAHSETNK